MLFSVAAIVCIRLVIYLNGKLKLFGASTFCESAQVSGNIKGERAAGNVRHLSL